VLLLKQEKKETDALSEGCCEHTSFLILSNAEKLSDDLSLTSSFL
jgi:hypothetical protein